MKNYIITTALLIISFIGFSQVSPSGQFRVATVGTSFGINLPVGTQVFCVGTNDLYKVTVAEPSTASISAQGVGTLVLVAMPTNLSVGTTTATTLNVNSSTGSSVTLPAVTATTAGLMTAAQEVLLAAQSGTNTGNVTLAGTGTYLSIAGQVITVNPIYLSTANATGILAATSFPALTGDVTNTVGTLGTTIGPNKVTYGKIQAMTTQSLIGSGATGTAAENITLGTGLSFSGTTLNTTNAGSTYMSESFEEGTGGIGRTYALTNLPNTITTGLTVMLNGMPLIADLTVGYTNALKVVTIHVPVYIYDKLTVSYTY